MDKLLKIFDGTNVRRHLIDQRRMELQKSNKVVLSVASCTSMILCCFLRCGKKRNCSSGTRLKCGILHTAPQKKKKVEIEVAHAWLEVCGNRTACSDKRVDSPSLDLSTDLPITFG